MADQLKVTLLFRKRSPYFNSIEELFENLGREIRKSIPLQTMHLHQYSNGLRNKLKNIRQVKKLSNGILHITGEVYYAGLLYRGPMVVTVHDMGSIQAGNSLKRTLIKWLWFQRIAEKAAAIVVISEQSRKEYLSAIRIDKKKVHLIHNPVPPQLKPKDRSFNDDCPVLLQVGTKPNKNIERLIEAVSGINCHLKLIGPLTAAQKALLTEHRINYSNGSGLTTEELHNCYYEADVVTFVSTYEGFGMPVIEAQAVGRPVLSSAVSSLPEVAGKGALLVDPYSVEAIRKGVERLINEPELRQELVTNGFENCQRFSIEQIANQYITLYKQVGGEAR
jgi:glycosyltransferase involved in cell wall biosynthesis